MGNNEPVSIVDEVPFEIPESWEWCRLGELFSTIMGQSPKGNTVSIANDGIEFHQGKICFGDMYLEPSEQTTSAPTKIAPSNSVLLCVRAPVGKVNITKREICIGRGLCAVIPHANMTAEYTYYLLETYEEILKKQATGTTFVAVTGEVVKNQLIPVPPIQEQQRIVAKIRELLPFIVEYNKKETKISELNTSFPDRLKKSILLEAVMGKLVPQDENDEPASALLERIREEKKHLIAEGKLKKDKHESIIYRRDNSHYEKIGNLETCIDDEIPFEIPDSWEWVRFYNIVSFENGDRSKKYPVESDYVTEGIPFFGAKDMSDKYMSYNDVRFISEAKFEELGNGKLQDGDMICLLRGSVGKTRIFKASSQYSTGFICAQMMIIRCINLGLLEYLYTVILSPYFTQLVESKITGTAVRQLPAKEVANLLIPVPPIEEQERIIQAINKINSHIYSL